MNIDALSLHTDSREETQVISIGLSVQLVEPGVKDDSEKLYDDKVKLTPSNLI